MQVLRPSQRENSGRPTLPEMHEGGYFTYIMASRSRTLYVGVTGDLLRRVFQHKWKEHDGFSAKYNCDRLVWFERNQDVTKAIAREKQLKNWGREKKLALIGRTNPAWACASIRQCQCPPCRIPQQHAFTDVADIATFAAKLHDSLSLLG